MSAVQSLKNSFTYVGVLLILEGLSFLMFPNLATKLLFFMPLQTAEGVQFARGLGLAVAVIGYYYFVAGKYTLIDFYRASVIARAFVLPLITAMIYFYSMQIQFIVFGFQDLVTALWSYTCLKAYDAEQAKLKK